MSSNDFWADVRVILRNENHYLSDELIALTGFSLTRAMDSVEGALDPGARRQLTTEVIAPLEHARASIWAAVRRRGSDERIVLPGDVADLCRCQYHALCGALVDPSFPYDQLPVELQDPVTACARFYRAAGLPIPELIAGSALGQLDQRDIP